MQHPKSLVVIAFEPPAPANHGARVDIWNRYRRLKTLGWELTLITWVSNPATSPDPETKAEISRVFKHVHYLDVGWGPSGLFRRIRHLMRYNYQEGGRAVDRKTEDRLVDELKKAAPSAIMLDAIFGGVLAKKLARRLGVPLFYRSHNIEYLYNARQAAHAQSLRDRLRFAMIGWRLKDFEMSIRTSSAWVFDISVDDMAHWASLGFANHSWLPPFSGASEVKSVDPAEWRTRPFDCAYLGNLNTPNNVKGLVWLANEVMPLVARRRPGVRLLIAGSNPVSLVKTLRTPGGAVQLVENPSDIDSIYSQARVLLNPVQFGSGVNVKSVEMLYSGLPIVTTSAGVQGLAPSVKALYRTADSSEKFAAAIADLLDAPIENLRRPAIGTFFGQEAAEALSSKLLRLMRSTGETLAPPQPQTLPRASEMT